MLLDVAQAICQQPIRGDLLESGPQHISTLLHRSTFSAEVMDK
jgi:hypothetical protein